MGGCRHCGAAAGEGEEGKGLTEEQQLKKNELARKRRAQMEKKEEETKVRSACVRARVLRRVTHRPRRRRPSTSFCRRQGTARRRSSARPRAASRPSSRRRARPSRPAPPRPAPARRSPSARAGQDANCCCGLPQLECGRRRYAAHCGRRVLLDSAAACHGGPAPGSARVRTRSLQRAGARAADGRPAPPHRPSPKRHCSFNCGGPRRYALGPDKIAACSMECYRAHTATAAAAANA